MWPCAARTSSIAPGFPEDRRTRGACTVEHGRCHRGRPASVRRTATTERDRTCGRVEAADGWQRALRGQHAERARLLIGPRCPRTGAVSDRADPELLRFARVAGAPVRPGAG